jgi:hypothetical protein
MKYKLYATSILCLILAGCGGGSSSETTAPASTTTTPIAKPVINYSKAILPFYAGSYIGEECYGTLTSGGINMTLPPQTMTITQGGTMSASQVGTISMIGETYNLLDSTGLIIERKLNVSGPVSVQVQNLVVNPSTGRLVNFQLFGGEPSFGLLVGGVQKGIETFVACGKSNDASTLIPKSIYPFISNYINSSSIDLVCGTTLTNSTYQLLNGVVKFNNESYSLTSGLATERLTIAPGPKLNLEKTEIIYSTTSLDGRAFSVSLNTYGEMIAMGFTSSNGGLNPCFLKKF